MNTDIPAPGSRVLVGPEEADTETDIAYWLRQQRTARGVSLRRLGDLLGVSFSTLARIERREGLPDLHTLHQLRAWLSLDAALPPCQCVKCLHGIPSRLGWRCPDCARCFAPTVFVCPYCPEEELSHD
jgi:transcriptional regulator with XRE-family HTH domain